MWGELGIDELSEERGIDEHEGTREEVKIYISLEESMTTPPTVNSLTDLTETS